jgi:hypothetical protein
MSGIESEESDQPEVIQKISELRQEIRESRSIMPFVDEICSKDKKPMEEDGQVKRFRFT